MKNQSVYISVTEDERYLNIDGDLGLLNQFMAAFRGEPKQDANETLKGQPVPAGQGGNHEQRR